VENALATDENIMTRRERRINFIDVERGQGEGTVQLVGDLDTLVYCIADGK
jgi:hypothetical protein